MIRSNKRAIICLIKGENRMVNKREGTLLTSTFILLILFVISLFKIVQLEYSQTMNNLSNGELVENNNEEDFDQYSDDVAVPAIATVDETAFFNWNTARLTYITLNLTDKAFDAHQYIYDEAEQVIGDIEIFFDDSLNHSIPVFIHSGESYLVGHRFANYNFNIQEGSLSNEAIVINVDDFVLTERADLRLIFAHEMTHAFIHHSFGFDSIDADWFHEGVAEFVSRYMVDYSDISAEHYMGLTGSIQDNLIYLFENLEMYDVFIEPEKITLFRDTEQYEDYFLYESIFYFLYDQFGEQKLLEFIEQYSKLKSNHKLLSNQVFKNVYHFSEEELVEQWKNYYDLID